mmetsp:Transcript_52168/g.102153  ORF Transcript_52168/g.102153 Transcript_52168/m.102153 type:complete len:262 (-) Transcript_52168:385-1170(-)
MYSFCYTNNYPLSCLGFLWVFCVPILQQKPSSLGPQEIVKGEFLGAFIEGANPLEELVSAIRPQNERKNEPRVPPGQIGRQRVRSPQRHSPSAKKISECRHNSHRGGSLSLCLVFFQRSDQDVSPILALKQQVDDAAVRSGQRKQKEGAAAHICHNLVVLLFPQRVGGYPGVVFELLYPESFDSQSVLSFKQRHLHNLTQLTRHRIGETEKTTRRPRSSCANRNASSYSTHRKHLPSSHPARPTTHSPSVSPGKGSQCNEE